LPTVITHSVIGLAATFGFNTRKQSIKLILLSTTCSILPDADIIGYYWLFIPSYDFFGHRGFFHSPFFAVMVSVLVVYLFFRKDVNFSKKWWKLVVYFFILTASHGLLDAFTNGGNGIALLSPISNGRYFFPWTPIEVSPLGIKALFSKRGLEVLISELLWVWAPILLLFLFSIKMRNQEKEI
jgi:inner membrane protein